MVQYEIIQPPFALKLREMHKKQLEAYREWFHAIMPARLVALATAVKETPGFQGWMPDLSPDSLRVLGDWFSQQVETRPRTLKEKEEIESRLTFSIDVPSEELTPTSFSLAMDVGMYFGQVVLKNLPGTRWDQPLKNPRFADYGQPVIMGFGTVPLNPVRIALMLAYAFSAKEQSGDRLLTLYETWAAKRR
jgi:hypothetical protein